ncbi:Ig-like domain-containing protein [Gayadomonas joobiniege]|uniref:Ig-like domain-containing protein n=1 Tax=Gayadomonas joobiniege TaxID=1234606 RepID=UPI00037B005D|nr:Ig-like domain-containing protein [Gayadomonas joobiniege]
MYKLTHCALGISLALTMSGLAKQAVANPTQVKIYPHHKLYIGDTSDLQRNKFFNLHTSPSDPAMQKVERDYLINELNADFGRAFSSPFNRGMGSHYPDTQSVMQNGANSLQNYNKFPHAGYDVSRMVSTEHPYNVIVDGNDPIDGARFIADYYQNYFNDENRPGFYEPMNEPFVHAHEFVDGPWNNENNEAMQRHMATWFAEIGREFDARGIPVDVVGFSSAWPSLELNNFNHWQTRMKMFIDTAGQYMDALSFHLYDGVNVTGQDNLRSGANTEAIMDLQETYTKLTFNRVIPHAVTEYGGIIDGYPDEYSAEKSSQELRSYNHILFSLLAREDRLLTSIPFITGTAQWYYQANNFNPYSATIYRPDPDKIVNGKVNGFLETEKAKFYKLWADVKGYRVDFSEQDADLGTQIFAHGNKLYVCLNNFDNQSKTVNLDFMQQLEVTNLRVKRLDVPYGQAARYSDQSLATHTESFTLNPDETLVAEYQLQDNLPIAQAIGRDTYYAQQHLQAIEARQIIQFDINGVDVEQDQSQLNQWVASQMDPAELVLDKEHPQGEKFYPKLMQKYQRQIERLQRLKPDDWQQTSTAQRLFNNMLKQPYMGNALAASFNQNGYSQAGRDAVLRMSISRKHDKSKQPQVWVNGFAVTVPDNWAGLDQINRDDFFAAIEIPVPSQYLKTDNKIDIQFDDSQGFISSLILEVETAKSLDPVISEAIELNLADVVMNKNDKVRVRASVLPENTLNKSLSWQIADQQVAQVDDSGLITAKAPGSTTLTVSSIDGGSQTQINVEVRDRLSQRNTVTFVESMSELPETDTISLDIAYDNDQVRDLVLSLYDAQNKFVKESRVQLPVGEGVQTLQLLLDNPLQGGSEVRLLASLRSVGGDWRTTIDSHDMRNIPVIAEQTTEPDPTQLLAHLNADFEAGSLIDWSFIWDAIGTVDVVAGGPEGSSYVANVDTTAGKTGLLIGQDLPVAAGKKYLLSMDIKKTQGSGWGGGFVQLINNENGWVGSPQGPWFGTSQNGQWMTFEKEIDGADWPEQGTQLQIVFGTQGHFWELDNVRLQDITPEANLLASANGDFESGLLEPWVGYWENNSSTALTVTSLASDNSNHVLKIQADGTKNTGITLPVGYTPQQLGDNDGSQYQISFKVRSLNTPINGWFRLVAQGSWNTRIETWFNADTEWKEVTVIRDSVDWSQNANEARIDLYINANAAGIDVEVDDIQITRL